MSHAETTLLAPINAAAEIRIYRRIPVKYWNHNDRSVEPAAFVPHPGQSLSVFNASIVPHPRYLFDHHIAAIRARLEDPNVNEQNKEKIRLRQQRGELTPEYMYRDGWRIAELPLSEFLVNEFTVEPPDSDGHQNILGQIEDFQTFAPRWAELARMLSQEETLGT